MPDSRRIYADDSEAREAARLQMRARSRRITQAANEIVEIPEVLNPEVKEACKYDLEAYLTTYHSNQFFHEFSDMHRSVIRGIQNAVLHGESLAAALPRGSGKALALDTPIPTPDGWKTMGEIKEGDFVIGKDGIPCRVSFVSEIQQRRSFEIEFSSGEKIKACAEHQWMTNAHVDQPGTKGKPGCTAKRDLSRVRTTQEIFDTQRYGSRGDKNHSVDLGKALLLPDAHLEIDPYIMGAWLGDGSSHSNQFTCSMDDAHNLKAQATAAGYSFEKSKYGGDYLYLIGRGSKVSPASLAEFKRLIKLASEGKDLSVSERAKLRKVKYQKSLEPSLRSQLARTGVINNKHIPIQYLRSSFNQRLSLLQGIMDTDGTCSKDGKCELSLCNKRLAYDSYELIRSLGIRVNIKESDSVLEGRVVGRRWRMSFTTHLPIFRLERKLKRLNLDPCENTVNKRSRVMINEVKEIPPEPMKCIMVENEDHMFLCGRSMIPTHNSTIMRLGMLWAILYGHRRCGVLIASTSSAATRGIKLIKNEFLTNDLLLFDFPEAIYPIRCLNRSWRRSTSQTLDGVHTSIDWKGDHITLPTVKDSPCSGSILWCGGITGEIRGFSGVTEEGDPIRPDIAMVDDPSTKESAKSKTQSEYRLSIINNDISKMAGPNSTCPIMCAVTVIYEGDLASMLIDREMSPQFHGIKYKMIETWPLNKTLVDEYVECVRVSMRRDGGYENAHQFFLDNREELSIGASVSWEDRYTEQECCALEFALREFAQGAQSFANEYQNDPLEFAEVDGAVCTAKEIAHKQHPVKRRIVPSWANKVVCSIDVQQHIIYYVVAAVDNEMNGAVIDYGTLPDQKRSYFSVRDVSKRMIDRYETDSIDQACVAGVADLIKVVAEAEWRTEDGDIVNCGRILVDSGYKTEEVYAAIRLSGHAGIAKPSRGMPIRARDAPMRQYRYTERDTKGHHWCERETEKRRFQVQIDVNYWKSQFHKSFKQTWGDGQAWFLWSTDPFNHRMFSDHGSAEYSIPVSAKGRTVEEWGMRPGQTENHWFDCTVACMVAANMLGSKLKAIQSSIEGPSGGRKKIRRSVKWKGSET